MLNAAELTPLDVLTKVSFDPAPILFVALTTAWYIRSVRRLTARHQYWPAFRSASFCLGEVALAVATISGLGAFDRTNFIVQAVQYSVVGMVVPVLFALGGPLTLATEAAGERTRRVASRLQSGTPGRVLGSPVFTWPVYAAPLFVLYFTGLCGVAISNPVIDQVIYLVLLLSGSVFCWSVVAVDVLPVRRSHLYRIIYLLLSLPLYSILGMALESQGSSIAHDISINDLHTGGGIIWVIAETVSLGGAIAVFVSWLKADERTALRSDEAAETAAAAQLAHWRAARDAAARAIS